MIRIYAPSVVTSMQDIQCWHVSVMNGEAYAVGVVGFAVDAERPIALTLRSALPFPTVAGLVHPRPELFNLGGCKCYCLHIGPYQVGHTPGCWQALREFLCGNAKGARLLSAGPLFGRKKTGPFAGPVEKSAGNVQA